MQALKKKTFLVCLLIGVSLSLTSCNEGIDGFGAPVGSSVEVSSLTSVTTNSDVYALMTITVKVVQGEGETLVPGNGISTIVGCQNCTILDRAEGQAFTIPDPNFLQTVSNPYTFQTGSNGNYSVVLLLDAPSDLGETSYTATFFADIGVASAQTQITVSEP